MKDIDFLFNITEDDLDAQKWAELTAVFERLPHYVGSEQGPHWFGLENDPVHLEAHMEPPGIQVTGIVTHEDWNAWSATFIAQTSNFLGFEVRGIDLTS